MINSNLPWFRAAIRLVLLGLFWLPTSQAAAQPPTPGQVRESLKPGVGPLEKEAPLPEIKLPVAPPPPPVDERRVRIERFVIEGNTVFSEDELRAVIADWAGAELTLSEIYGVADLLTNFYQSRGYSLAIVTVPAQKMQAGILRLEVVEGRVGKLVFAGNQRYSADFLARQLDLVRPGAILRFAELEREVLLLNELPGLVARSVLQPGEAYGTSDISFNIEETRAAALVTFDNHGPEVVGKGRAGVDFTINNPGKFGDLLTLGYTHSQSNLLRQGRIGYGLPLHPSGTRLQLSYSRAEYDVGGEFVHLGIDGRSETARLQVSQPLLKDRRTSLSWLLGGAHIKGRSDLSGLPLSDDEVSFLETGLNFSHRHRHGGVSALSGMLATNFRGNGAGDRATALPPRLELKGSYEHPFSHGWSGLVRGEAVLTTDPMPDSNKYNLGGPTSVRGFVSSRVRGDQGALGSLELKHLSRFTAADLQLRGFFDAGTVSSHDLPGAPGASESLTGAGAGLSAVVANRYVLDLQWAKPLDGKESGEGRNAQFWLNLSAGF